MTEDLGIYVELAVKTDGSREWLERARKSSPGGVQGDGRWYEPYPLFINRAQGAHIWDVDGNKFLDYWGSAGPAILGHNDPTVRAEVIRTLHEEGVLFTAPHPKEVELAELLCALIPCADKVSLCGGGGSDAVYNAVRVARAFTGRKKLLKFEGGYHGWHDYLAASIKPSPEDAGSSGAPNTVPVSAGSLPEAIEQIVVAPYNDGEAFVEIIRRERDQLAAVFIEPVSHSAGCLLIEPDFLKLVRETCTREGIVLIFDEIITGFRHDLGGAQRLLGVTPDLAVFGKAMANGFPISAVAGRRDIMSMFSPEGPVFISGTYNGHLLGVTAALATISLLRDGTIHERLFSQGAWMASRVSEVIDHLELDASFAQFGSALCLYFTRRVRSFRDIMPLVSQKGGSPRDIALRRWLLNDDIFILPIKTNKGYISAAHTDSDIEKTTESMTRFLTKYRLDLSAKI
ncbi:MAG: aspartate aminotransferase family protein [Nitrospiraceae bacterium]|nr:aspartate aminotransferase family protein [Nitrospiraceae bacterium]